jgi:hypothetical protein
MCHDAPCFHTNSKEIVELSSLWNLFPIDLSLAPAKQVNLEVLTQVIYFHYLSFSNKTHKLLKFSIAIWIECVGFAHGALPYFSFFHTSVIVDVTWCEAIPLACASW